LDLQQQSDREVVTAMAGNHGPASTAGDEAVRALLPEDDASEPIQHTEQIPYS
jgi:V8-like Glu-specific endopeptidase